MVEQSTIAERLAVSFPMVVVALATTGWVVPILGGTSNEVEQPVLEKLNTGSNDVPSIPLSRWGSKRKVVFTTSGLESDLMIFTLNWKD